MPGVLRSAAALALAWAPAALAAAPDHDEVRACLRANVPARSSAATLRLLSRDRAGREYAHEARLLWRKGQGEDSSMLVCLTEPRDVRDVAYLVRTEDGAQTLWVYLPEEGRALRINPRAAASRGRIARTAVGYRDLRYLPFNLAEARVDGLGVTRFEGRTAWRVPLELPPRSVYGSVEAWIDAESCVPLRVDSYGEGGELRKRITAEPESVSEVGGVRLARSLSIEDPENEVVTEVSVESVEVDVELPERLFEPGSFAGGRCPRP